MPPTKYQMRIVLETIKKNIPLQCDLLLAALDNSDIDAIGKQKYTMLCQGLAQRMSYYTRIIFKWKKRNNTKNIN